MSNERSGILVVLACHCVYDDDLDCIYAEHPEDRPIYESHVNYAFNHLKWRKNGNPLLVISGGFTKIQKYCSESRSYIQMANNIGLALPENIALEEYALTSIENLLFSLYVYKDIRKVYPKEIDVISWEFKRTRFQKTLEAINNWKPIGEQWNTLNFFPVGDLWGNPQKNALGDEKAYIDSLGKGGLVGYYNLQMTKDMLEKRDVYNSRSLAKIRYKDYSLPF